jgi:hypothetical protein
MGQENPQLIINLRKIAPNVDRQRGQFDFRLDSKMGIVANWEGDCESI